MKAVLTTCGWLPYTVPLGTTAEPELLPTARTKEKEVERGRKASWEASREEGVVGGKSGGRGGRSGREERRDGRGQLDVPRRQRERAEDARFVIAAYVTLSWSMKARYLGSPATDDVL